MNGNPRFLKFQNFSASLRNFVFLLPWVAKIRFFSSFFDFSTNDCFYATVILV